MSGSPPNASQSTADGLLGRYGAMKDEIAAIRATASSSDRAVTVVAGPGGAVMDIKLTEQALAASSAQALGSAIMSTLRLAVADAARQQAAVVQRYVGDRMNLLDRVMNTQQEIFGERIAEGDAEAARLAAQPGNQPDPDSVLVADQPARPAAQDEDDTGGSVLSGSDAW